MEEQEKVETEEKPKQHPVEIIGELMATFSAIVRGQISCNEAMTDADKIAAFTLMGQVMLQANVIVLSRLSGLPEANVPLSWTITPCKTVKSATMYAEEMLGFVQKEKEKEKDDGKEAAS